MLCAVGGRCVWVVDIPRAVPSRSTRQLRVLEHFLETREHVEILRVQWHPLSPSHLAILTSDNTLRYADRSMPSMQLLASTHQSLSLSHSPCSLMNISKDLETPEQSFHLSTLPSIHPVHGVKHNAHGGSGKHRRPGSLGGTPLRRSNTRTYALSSDSSGDDDDDFDDSNDLDDQDNDDDLLDKERFVSFSFSGSRRGWDQFTVFVMADSGLVYRLCPVVPEECVVPHSLLSFLHQGIDQLPIKLSSYAQSIKQWLTEISGQKLRGPKAGADSSSAASSLPTKKTKKQRHTAAAAANSPNDLDSSATESSEVWYRTCAPSTLRSKTLALQGPINLCTPLSLSC